MKNLIAISLFIPFLSQASIVPLFDRDSSRPNDFSKPTIYQYHNLEKSIHTPSKIVSLQKKLKRKGIYSGRINGKLNFETKRAVEKFQNQNGIFIKDVITQSTINLLNNKRSKIAAK